MRLKISNLNYLQREIMIMRYIDGLSIKSISKKLSITEANVKWHLYDTRNKLKKELNEMADTNFVYRPGKLHMAVSGNSGPAPDTDIINENLVRQNICLACYKESKTTDELADMLGIAKAYIEYDLQWLTERQFVKRDNGKYRTLFSIKDYNYQKKTLILFLENKKVFSDVIIDKLIAKQDKIKAIGFYGADRPIEKLMWFLLYTFVNYVQEQVVWVENKYPQPEYPIMPDGGQYFPLGFDWVMPEKGYDLSSVPNWDEKYKHIVNWHSNGDMTGSPDNYSLHWYGLYTAGNHTLEQLFDHYSGKNFNTCQVLLKTLEKDFDINSLDDDEKEILSEIISNRWVTKKGDKLIHNFSVLTKSQALSLTNVYEEIYNELKGVIYNLYAEMEKFCRGDLPAHLEFYLNYHIYMTFYNAGRIITGFAFYDGKIYEPKDEIECGLLTFHVITNLDD
jgi:DNA-binding CsgD family transcriptional regulator